MLIRQLPEQVEAEWDLIKPCIMGALPPYVRATHNAMTNILTAILLEDADVWKYAVGKEIHAILLTYIRRHDLTGQKQLEIYAVYGTEAITPEKYKDIIDTLKKYARAKACEVIIGYTALDKWAHFLRMHGANTEWRLIEWEL